MQWNIQVRVSDDEDIALHSLNAHLLLACHDLEGVRCTVEVDDERMGDIVRRLHEAGVLPALDVMQVLSIAASAGSLMTIRTVIVTWLVERKKPTLVELTLPDGRTFKIDSQLTTEAQEKLISEAFRLAAEDPTVPRLTEPDAGVAPRLEAE
ncbi:hypothetical protein OG196_15515 [Kitasatospora purpeofusca]|uniref:effector-associated constant component EACC1 n=1 Tax=Kitasatospora purpeofusca TaxID=67352 RepID=UPI002E139F07|nr:hypothetical protein OG196_15515 [Kitasatospora purpeofusca]